MNRTNRLCAAALLVVMFLAGPWVGTGAAQPCDDNPANCMIWGAPVGTVIDCAAEWVSDVAHVQVECLVEGYLLKGPALGVAEEAPTYEPGAKVRVKATVTATTSAAFDFTLQFNETVAGGAWTSESAGHGSHPGNRTRVVLMFEFGVAADPGADQIILPFLYYEGRGAYTHHDAIGFNVAHPPSLNWTLIIAVIALLVAVLALIVSFVRIRRSP